MSLEQHIQENTAAIRELIGLLSKATLDTEPPVAETAKPARAKPKKEAAPEATAGESSVEQSAPSPDAGAIDAPATEAVATATDAPPTYGEVAPYVTRVAKEKGKAAVLELLGKFNVSHFSQVDETQYAKVLAEAKRMLGE